MDWKTNLKSILDGLWNASQHATGQMNGSIPCENWTNYFDCYVCKEGILRDEDHSAKKIPLSSAVTIRTRDTLLDILGYTEVKQPSFTRTESIPTETLIDGNCITYVHKKCVITSQAITLTHRGVVPMDFEAMFPSREPIEVWVKVSALLDVLDAYFEWHKSQREKRPKNSTALPKEEFTL